MPAESPYSPEYSLHTPGTIIELGDLGALPAFEDIVALQVNPNMTTSQFAYWAGRIDVRPSLQPENFDGSIQNVVLTVMQEPYARLLDARERGWKFFRYSKPSTVQSEQSRQDQIARTIGLQLIADATGPRQSDHGQIKAELWYSPVHPYRIGTGGPAGETFSAHVGSSIIRRGTVPRYSRENFIELDATARRVGFAALRVASQKTGPFGFYY